FHGGFGLIAADGIKKPSFYQYELLHRLGQERLPNPAEDVLVTRHPDQSLTIALWNLVEPNATGAPRHIRLEFRNVSPNAEVLVWRVDEKHSNSLAGYRAMGSPQYPTQKQVEQLNRENALAAPELTTLHKGALELDLPVNALLLLELRTW